VVARKGLTLDRLLGSPDASAPFSIFTIKGRREKLIKVPGGA
jgi:hypothetical protein